MEGNYKTFDGNSRKAHRGHDDNCGSLICCACICTLIGCFGLLYVTGRLFHRGEGTDNGEENLLLLAEKIAEKMSNNITANITEKLNTTLSR